MAQSAMQKYFEVTLQSQFYVVTALEQLREELNERPDSDLEAVAVRSIAIPKMLDYINGVITQTKASMAEYGEGQS